jgi:hypothetical protein
MGEGYRSTAQPQKESQNAKGKGQKGKVKSRTGKNACQENEKLRYCNAVFSFKFAGFSGKCLMGRIFS